SRRHGEEHHERCYGDAGATAATSPKCVRTLLAARAASPKSVLAITAKVRWGLPHGQLDSSLLCPCAKVRIGPQIHVMPLQRRSLPGPSPPPEGSGPALFTRSRYPAGRVPHGCKQEAGPGSRGPLRWIGVERGARYCTLLSAHAASLQAASAQ